MEDESQVAKNPFLALARISPERIRNMSEDELAHLADLFNLDGYNHEAPVNERIEWLQESPEESATEVEEDIL